MEKRTLSPVGRGEIEGAGDLVGVCVGSEEIVGGRVTRTSHWLCHWLITVHSNPGQQTSLGLLQPCHLATQVPVTAPFASQVVVSQVHSASVVPHQSMQFL